ncbi:MAG: methionyl-tRNA formyltransferase, partial [Nitrospirota bacterium]
GLDTGDILLQRAVPLDPRETAATLHDKLAALGGPLLVETLLRLEAGSLTASPQDDEASSYIPKLTRGDGLLDWSQPAVVLDRRIRGFTPWPGAFTFLEGRRLNVRGAHPVDTVPAQAPGHVEAVTHDALLVATADGCLALTEVQLEGKRPLPVAGFLAGHPLPVGTQLG